MKTWWGDDPLQRIPYQDVLFAHHLRVHQVYVCETTYMHRFHTQCVLVYTKVMYKNHNRAHRMIWHAYSGLLPWTKRLRLLRIASAILLWIDGREIGVLRIRFPYFLPYCTSALLGFSCDYITLIKAMNEIEQSSSPVGLSSTWFFRTEIRHHLCLHLFFSVYRLVEMMMSTCSGK